MNSIERIKAASAFAPTDRMPVVPAVLGHAAVLAGVPLRDYLCDGDLLARCQLQALQHYGYDAVFAFMDLYVEAEAVGSVLQYYEHQYPEITDYVIAADGALDGLITPDPHNSGRMPELLRAASVLRKEVGEQTLVIGAVTGPMTLATQLIGMEDGIYLAADDPDRFEQILDFATEIAIHYGIAQLEAGVHLPMIFDPAASSVIVPPRFFAEFLQPRIKRILTAFHQAGALLHWLMITGTIDPILKYCAELGLDILHVDYDVTPARILQDLPRTCVAGNFRPLSFVTSTPEKITAEVHALAKLFATRGGLLLSAGCEIPPEAKAENIAALVAAARSHHG